MGEGLGLLSDKELKQLELRLERGTAKIRSKKRDLLLEEIECMKKQEEQLQHENNILRANMAAELDQRVQRQAVDGYENLFDSRSYSQLNFMEAPPNYPNHQDQTALHLGYQVKPYPSAKNLL